MSDLDGSIERRGREANAPDATEDVSPIEPAVATEAVVAGANPQTDSAEPDGAEAPSEDEALKQRLLEVRKQRKESASKLDQQFGKHLKVEGTKGFAWQNLDTGTAYVIRGNGKVVEISAGRSHNFGTREQPQWKKWGGKETGWADATPEDIQAMQPVKAERKRRGPLVREPNEDAPGIYSDPKAAPVFSEVNGILVVKRGNRVSTATPSEIAQYRARQEAAGATAAVDTMPLAEAPPVPPPTETAPAPVDVPPPVLPPEPSPTPAAEAAPEPMPSTPEPRRELRRFYPIVVGERARGGAAGAEPVIWQYALEVDEKGNPTVVETGSDGNPEQWSQEEMEKLRRQPNTEGDTVREPERNDRLDPRRVVVNRPRRGDSYDINPRDYVGIVVKPIRELLAPGNKRDGQLYGETLRALDHPDVAGVLTRYRDGNPTPADMDFMTYAAHEYARSLKIAEETNSMITPNELELLARRNKDLLNLTTHEGDARGTDMLKNAIVHIAMKHPADMEDLRDTLKGLKRNRDTFRYNLVELKIDALCGRLKITQKDYGGMIRYSSPAVRRASERQLAKRIHENAGGFRRGLDWFDRWVGTMPLLVVPGSSRDSAIRTIQEAEHIVPAGRSVLSPTSWVLRRIDDNLEDIATYLGASVANPDMRRLIVEETLSNQNSVPAIEQGPQTFAQVQELNRDQYSSLAIERRVRNRIRETPEWNSWPEDQQNATLRDWGNEEKRGRSGGGFWSMFFGFLLGTNYNKAASAATGRPIHV